MSQLVECVPNFSEGRDRAVIDAIARAISSVAEVRLLDVDPGADTNRTVYTFVGPPEAVAEAAFQGARQAAALIDMTKHKGEHPRIGALDVCPFVPVRDVTMADCVRIAEQVGTRIAESLDVPVYFYEAAASSEQRRSLADIRAGEYEGLERKLRDAAWTPDRGPAAFRPHFGACVVGARQFLIAYNINLNSRDRRLANEVALAVRENGRLARDQEGRTIADAQGAPVKVPGRLKAVRALGWYIEEYRQTQVSVNLLDYHATPLHVLFDTVEDEARKLGLRVTGSELVGLVPLEPMVEAGRFYLRRQGKSAGAPEDEIVETAVKTLGLDQLRPFEPRNKIIEYRVEPNRPLVSQPLRAFVDAVSAGTPAPGGGSVSALAGSLAGALGAMVGNLTVGKKGYEGASADMERAAEALQRLKDRLRDLVDLDTDAFNEVMKASRLPKATSEQASSRRAAIEAANRGAVAVPLETARRSVDVLVLLETVANGGNRNALSDAGVAAHLGRAAVEGALLNVLINLPNIDDQEFRSECSAECARLRDWARELAERILLLTTF